MVSFSFHKSLISWLAFPLPSSPCPLPQTCLAPPPPSQLTPLALFCTCPSLPSSFARSRLCDIQQTSRHRDTTAVVAGCYTLNINLNHPSTLLIFIQPNSKISLAGETLLEEVVVMAANVGLVKPQDHIVCVQRVGESFVIKIVSVNDSGDGVEIIRPKSLINLIRVSTPTPISTPQSTCLHCPWLPCFLLCVWSSSTFSKNLLTLTVGPRQHAELSSITTECTGPGEPGGSAQLQLGLVSMLRSAQL